MKALKEREVSLERSGKRETEAPMAVHFLDHQVETASRVNQDLPDL